jgi:hypothetical protein
MNILISPCRQGPSNSVRWSSAGDGRDSSTCGGARHNAGGEAPRARHRARPGHRPPQGPRSAHRCRTAPTSVRHQRPRGQRSTRALGPVSKRRRPRPDPAQHNPGTGECSPGSLLHIEIPRLHDRATRGREHLRGPRLLTSPACRPLRSKRPPVPQTRTAHNHHDSQNRNRQPSAEQPPRQPPWASASMRPGCGDDVCVSGHGWLQYGWTVGGVDRDRGPSGSAADWRRPSQRRCRYGRWGPSARNASARLGRR